MRQAIDQTGRGDLAHAPKIILVNFVNAAPDELPRAIGYLVEHLLGIVQVMNRAEDKIEFVVILFHPLLSRDRSSRIVVELDARANFHVRIRGAQFVDFVKVDSGMKAIVIGKGEIVQSACARTVA